MKINGNIITLSKKEAEEIIDKECRKRLNMSLKRFQQKRKDGGLQKSVAVSDIEMLLKFV